MLGKMTVTIITDSNNLIYLGAALARELLRLKETNQNTKR